MYRSKQILVIGYAEEHCTEKAYNLAYEVGKEIGRRKGILVTGGLRGVMEAASKGAKEAGGITVGIIPQEDKEHANSFCDVVIATGIGWPRDFITAYSGDSVIVIGGGAGTAIEVYAAYFKSKPIIALKGSGGIADKISDSYLDDRKLVKIMAAENPEKAVELAFSKLK